MSGRLDSNRAKTVIIIGLVLYAILVSICFNIGELFMTSKINSSSGLWIAAGLILFAIVMAILLSIARTNERQSGTVGTVYPYNPKDPTEGGRYPNPNDPSKPIVPLPPGHGGGTIYPVNPIKIIPDPVDSLRQIVSDRLNVLLEKENSSTGTEFMSEFKKLYPSPEYEFVYFDTLSYRMQLVVPVEERQNLKDNLNAQMPEFNFLLFDEEVMGMHYDPQDPGFSDKTLSWYFDAINVRKAWDVTKGSSDVIVAIVDNGFDLNHPEFAGKIVKPINIPERNTHIFPIIDQRGTDHGTHVAATAVGHIDNEHGVGGIAPGCMLMPIQVSTADGLMTTTSVFDGILYAIYNGAAVVNVSLGPEPPSWFTALSPMDQVRYITGDDQRQGEVWRKVYEIADKHNCIIVTSAGNSNIVSGFASKTRAQSVIVVSAVDRTFKKADFSNYGNFANLTSNYSTVSAPGVSILNAVNNGNYATLDGTSMASPIVAGSIALLKSIDPNLRLEDVKSILQNSGLRMLDPIGPLIQVDKAIELVNKNK